MDELPNCHHLGLQSMLGGVVSDGGSNSGIDSSLMMSSAAVATDSIFADLDPLTDLFSLPSDMKLDSDTLGAAYDLLDSNDSDSVSLKRFPF